MDEQENTSDNELDLGSDIEGDEIADTKQSDTEDQETESEDEQEQDTLNLEEDGKPEPKDKGKAETAREQMVNDWAKKVKGGLKSLSDIPKDQAWLKPLVEAQLNVKEQNLDDLVDQKLTEREQAKLYASTVDNLKSMGLDQEKRTVIESKYKAFKAKGLSKLDALEAAMEIAGVNPSEAALDSRRNAMRLRTPGNYKSSNVSDPASIHDNEGYGELAKRVDPEKRFEYLNKLRKS